MNQHKLTTSTRNCITIMGMQLQVNHSINQSIKPCKRLGEKITQNTAGA